LSELAAELPASADEGIVSKRRDLPYRSGRCRAWVKVKNPASPAVLRIANGTW
jgi:ATP-dependent DNA ligase